MSIQSNWSAFTSGNDSRMPAPARRETFIPLTNPGSYGAKVLFVLGLIGAFFPPIAYLYRWLVAPRQTIYLVGNSLGCLTFEALRQLMRAVFNWAVKGVTGWFDGADNWLELRAKVRRDLAKLVGAKETEVTATGTLGSNIWTYVLGALYSPSATRNKILIEKGAFPTDRYLVKAAIRKHFPGRDPADFLIEVSPEPGSYCVSTRDITQAIQKHSDTVALVFVGSVDYVTSTVRDMQSISALADEVGARVVFDDAHGIGILDRRYDQSGADAIVACGYKWANGGPGTIAILYVPEAIQKDSSIIWPQGWFGQVATDQFKMAQDFRRADGIAGLEISTPPIQLLAQFYGAIQYHLKYGMDKVRSRSLQLTDLVIRMAKELPGYGHILRIITPEDDHLRAGHVAIEFDRFELAHQIESWLARHGALCDIRHSPFKAGAGLLRLPPSPLYTHSREVARFMQLLQRAIVEIESTEAAAVA